MTQVVDSVRVNARQQKLHVRSFKPQQNPKALLVWHHGGTAAWLSLTPLRIVQVCCTTPWVRCRVWGARAEVQPL